MTKKIDNHPIRRLMQEITSDVNNLRDLEISICKNVANKLTHIDCIAKARLHDINTFMYEDIFDPNIIEELNLNPVSLCKAINDEIISTGFNEGVHQKGSIY